MPNPIDTTTFPGDDISPDAIVTAAASIRSTGSQVATQSATVVSSWQKLSADYEAPESGTLLSAMDPVKTEGELFSSQLDQAATALETFAEEARAIKTTLAGIRTEANAFTASIKGGVDKTTVAAHVGVVHETIPWDEDQASIDKNNALIAQVNAQQVLLWAAERKCANALHDLTGHGHVGAATEANPNGYGVDEIPAGADMPWGHKTERTESCGEKSVKAVWHFTADGLVGGVVGGTLQGVGGLLGFEFPEWDPRTWGWSLETGLNSWKGLGMVATALSPTTPVLAMIPGAYGQYYRDSYQALWTAAKGVVAADKWHDQPAAAAGETVGNIALMFVGIGEAAAGAKAAGAAAKAGRAGEEASAAAKALEMGSKVAKATDPLYLATQAAKFAGKAGGLSVEALSKLFKGLDLGRAADLHLPGSKIDLDLPAVDRDGVDVDRPVDHSSPSDAPPARDLPDDGGDHHPTRPESSDPAPVDRGDHDPGSSTRPGHDGPATSTRPDEHGPATATHPGTDARHRYDPEAPVHRTVNQADAPHGFTRDDVDAAHDRAPVDADGTPVDHRNGEPLLPDRADGTRAWHMKWDADAGQWVAENPGSATLRPGDLPLTGAPDSFGYDADGYRMPYANHRPTYAPEQELDVWEAAKNEDGEVWVDGPADHPVQIEWDPGSPRVGVWDMGHVATEPYRVLRQDYLDHRITLEEFLDTYRDPDNYQVEHPSVNRSHRNEIR